MSRALAFWILGCAGGLSLGCSPVEITDNPAGRTAGQPQITSGLNGHTVLSWLEASDDGHALKFTLLVDNAWSNPKTVHSGPEVLANWADVPSVFAVSDNHFLAAWPSRTNDMFHGYHIATTDSVDAGETWQTPRRPYADDSPTEHGFASLFSQSSGVGLVWLDGRRLAAPRTNSKQPASTQLRSRIADGEEVVLSDSVCDCCQTDITHTEHGPLLAFRGRSEEDVRDIFVARWQNERWQNAELVARDNWTIGACPINGPAISSHAQRAVVAWFTRANNQPRLQVAFAAAPNYVFQTPIDIDADTPIGRVGIALVNENIAAMIWLQAITNQRAALMLATVQPSGTVSEHQRIAEFDRVGPDPSPRIASSAEFIHIAWAEPGIQKLRTARFAVSSAMHHTAMHNTETHNTETHNTETHNIETHNKEQDE